MEELYEEPDEEEVEAARRRARAEARAWGFVLDAPQGRFVLRHVLAMTGLLAGGELSAEALAFREGQRSIGREILARIKEQGNRRFVQVLSNEEGEDEA